MYKEEDKDSGAIRFHKDAREKRIDQLVKEVQDLEKAVSLLEQRLKEIEESSGSL